MLGQLRIESRVRSGRQVFDQLCRAATTSLRGLPDFMIIGTQRGGTTSLYNYLIRHPDIAAASRKEVHYFDANLHQGIRWYKAHFPASLPTSRRRLTGEGTPYYLFHPRIPQTVHQLLPDIKLIAMLRNPVDRAYSHYQHEVRHGRESLTFEEAITAEPSRLQGEEDRMMADASYASSAHRRHSYLARGIYVDQVSRWLQLFGSRQLLVVRSEDFYADPGTVTNNVLSFLALSPLTLPEHRRYQAAEYSRMEDATRERLVEYFAPHNERLHKLVGRSFGWDR